MSKRRHGTSRIQRCRRCGEVLEHNTADFPRFCTGCKLEVKEKSDRLVASNAKFRTNPVVNPDAPILNIQATVD